MKATSRLLCVAALALAAAAAMAVSAPATAEPGAPPHMTASTQAIRVDVAPASMVVAPALVAQRLLSADPAASHREALRVIRTSLPPQVLRWSPGDLLSPPRTRVPIRV